MKTSKHELAVMHLTIDILEVYFKSGLMIEYEELDEIYQDSQRVIAHKSILQRRVSVIKRGINKAIKAASSYDNLIGCCIRTYTTPESLDNLANMIECFIMSLIYVSRFECYDAFINLLKIYRIIPQNCPAANIEYVDV